MHALIVGGGIGGLSTAVALQRIGLDVTVFERAPEIREVGAALSLWSNAVTALNRLGVGEAVVRHGSIYRYGRIMTNEGALLAESDMEDYCPGVPNVAVRRADLQRELLLAVGREKVVTGATCQAVRQTANRVDVSFENGTTATGDLLIGADGIHSAVRRALFGLAPPRYSGFTCWQGMADCDPVELRDGYAMYVGDGAQSGLFRCGPGKVYWFVALPAPAGGRDGVAGPRAKLLAHFAGCAPLLTSTIAATTDDKIRRHDLIDRPPTRLWGKGRVTLLGDAIHPTTPNLGQGACQAIEDAVFLADAMRQMRTSDGGMQCALRHYERMRYRRTTMVTRQSWHGGKVFGWKGRMLNRLRNGVIASKLGRWQAVKLMKELLDYPIPQLHGEAA